MIVKMSFFKAANKLFNMIRAEDDEDIMSRLLKIDKVEGPITSFLLKPTTKLNELLGRDAPILAMFGDYHMLRYGCKTCKSQDECYSLYVRNGVVPFIKMIDEEAQEKDIRVDIFLELWNEASQRKKTRCKTQSRPLETNALVKKENSALVDVIDHVECCIGKSDKCPYSDRLRFHMMDVRTPFSGEKYKSDMLFKLFDMIPDKNLNLYNYLSFAENLYQEYDMTELVHILTDLFVKFDSRSYFDNDFVKKNSRTFHEINKLPKKLAKLLLDSVNNLKFEIDFAVDQDNVLLNTLIPINVKSKSFLFSMQLFDLYSISRILKTPKDSNTSHLSVVYAGALHIKNIYDFLIKNGLYEVVKKNDSANIFAEDKVNKCVDF